MFTDEGILGTRKPAPENLATLVGREPKPEGFVSILFPTGSPRELVEGPATRFLVDLQINQIIAATVAGREQYQLKPYFYLPLQDLDVISYRHEVFNDLAQAKLRRVVDGFARAMLEMRRDRALADGFRDERQRQAMLVDAASIYCAAVTELNETLADAAPASRGLRAFGIYLAGYVKSSGFLAVVSDAAQVQEALAKVRYCVGIKGNRVTVTREEDSADYTAEVRQTFERFSQGQVKDYRRQNGKTIVDMNHVERWILDGVVQLFPGEFLALQSFELTHAEFGNELVAAFDREIQFYLAYLDLVAKPTAKGLSFCMPAVSHNKEVPAKETFDLALAIQIVARARSVVTNDIDLGGIERILVVSGPNQGGKTTFARTFGQLHYLAALGLPVPGKQARLTLPDAIFTHFELGENTKDLQGKLMDDLVRIHDILDAATPRSLLILSEIFTSTTLGDAIDLGTRIFAQIQSTDLVCVCVTFVEELSCLGPTVVSMVSTVEAENPAQRTFKVVRQRADGSAYAMVLAQKYGLDYGSLKGRINS
ncbi:MutS-related protein [Arthrobacter psychrochitiniphilus]|uniref:MutS-related protein n=1 Tax=Arthrobacter psychrochitiniphilus TaxID=291045 RepID=UPI003F7B3E67